MIHWSYYDDDEGQDGDDGVMQLHYSPGHHIGDDDDDGDSVMHYPGLHSGESTYSISLIQPCLWQHCSQRGWAIKDLFIKEMVIIL